MKKILILLLVFSSFLFSKCIPITCQPEGISGQKQIIKNIKGVDSGIKSKIQKFSSLHDKEEKQLERILKKQEEIIKQTAQKEVYLMKINHLSQILTSLIKAQEQ